MDLELIKNKLRNPTEYGYATPEEAKFAFENGYMGGPKTQEYYKELGLIQDDNTPVPPSNTNTQITGPVGIGAVGKEANVQQPQTHTPKQLPKIEMTGNMFDPDVSNADFSKPISIDAWNPVGLDMPKDTLADKTFTDGAVDPNKVNAQIQQAEAEQQRDKQLSNLAGRQKFRFAADSTADEIGAWSPVAIGGVFGGVDRSGEAAGYGEQARQNDYNAAQNEKLRQRNLQQATDNTIADKMAAAQAAGKWEQNARSLGAEGGAAATAAQNEAEDLDLKYEKELKNERADMSAQNLAEVNRNKLMGIGNRTNEQMTNYATAVEDSNNAYKSALANATASKKDNSTKNNTASNTNDNAENKSDTNTEESSVTENKDNNSTTDDNNTTESTDTTGTTSVAPSNKMSEGVTNITDQTKAQQLREHLESIRQQVNAAVAANDTNKLIELKRQYDEDQEQFNALPNAAKQGGVPQFNIPVDIDAYGKPTSKQEVVANNKQFMDENLQNIVNGINASTPEGPTDEKTVIYDKIRGLQSALSAGSMAQISQMLESYFGRPVSIDEAKMELNRLQGLFNRM